MNESEEYLRGRIRALESVNEIMVSLLNAALEPATRVQSWLVFRQMVQAFAEHGYIDADPSFRRGFIDSLHAFEDKFLGD